MEYDAQAMRSGLIEYKRHLSGRHINSIYNLHRWNFKWSFENASEILSALHIRRSWGIKGHAINLQEEFTNSQEPGWFY